MKFSVSLNEKESILLLDYMKEDKIKSKAEAIRKCIRENIQKKLLEQFYANMKFPVDKGVKIESGLVRFCENNNFYSNKIME